MKILALADIHGREDVSYMVQELSGTMDFDLIAIAGDITDFGPGYVAETIINYLPGAVMAVPGNCDPPDVIEAIERSKGYNLHKKIVEYRGFRFAGLGGVNGGFNMGITFTDEYASEFLGACSNCILLLHQPPFGILDTAHGRRIGSRGIKKAVELAEPALVISGHVHEARGYKKIGGTLFVNPGPARDGYASLIDVEREKVEMISI